MKGVKMKKLFLWLIVISMITVFSLVGCKAGEEAAEEVEEGYKIAWVPAVMGVPYFNLENDGFEEALSALGDEVIYVGPETGTAEETNEVLEALLMQGVDGINFVPTDPSAHIPICQDLREAGIVLVENASDLMGENVDFHAFIMDNRDMTRKMLDSMAELIDWEGEFAIISASITSAVQNEQLEYFDEFLQEDQYSKMELVAVEYSDDIRDKAIEQAKALLISYPNLKGIIGTTSTAMPAAGMVIQDQGLVGQIKITGSGLPSESAEYIRSGAIDEIFLWDVTDLGIFMALVTRALVTGELTGAVGETIDMSDYELPVYEIEKENQLIFGEIYLINKDNIDDWDHI